MRASEAMRLGATLHKQAFMSFFNLGCDGETRLRIVATCALGSISAALGATAAEQPELYAEAYPWIVQDGDQRLCPAECGGVMGRTDGMIVHLNDDHHWTREQIADWLETVEPNAGAVLPVEKSEIKSSEIQEKELTQELVCCIH